MSGTFTASLLGIAILLWSGAVGAEAWDADEERARAQAYRHCDPDERARLLFLERRMEDHATYARWWRRGWNTFYTVGIAWETTHAVLEVDHRGARANHIAGASKAVVGLARGWWSRPIASRGLPSLDESLDHLEEDGMPEDPCGARLEVAHDWLAESAKQSHRQRWGWIPRTVNIALNGVAAVVVAEAYDYDAAYLSGGIGIAVGELRLWSYPYQAKGILEDYERTFDEDAGPVEPETSWSIEPWTSGARFVVRF